MVYKMRITTKVINNNALHNINLNKLTQDKLSQQMSTEKKVNRPSDDPVVAIRALRLRTNVNQINQYYEKNVPDAESWLSVTESALSSMSEVVTDMIKQCTKGSMEDLTSSDRETILTALKELREEVYSTGNADYAGRYIFTGYRTDSSLTFTNDVTKKYSITEQIDSSKLDTITYVKTGKITEINESNYETNDYKGIKETQVETSEIYRLRLSYDDADNNKDTTEPVIKYTYIDQNGDKATGTINCTVASIYDTDNPYENIEEDDAVLIAETGEILLGKNNYNKLMATRDDSETVENEGEIQVTYEKSEWKEGDLKPEHYFACTETDAFGQEINYNQDYLDGVGEKQAIEYDVGLNQRIRVNTTADEVFTHDITRDVDDLIKAMEDTVAMENVVNKLTKMLQEGNYNDDQKAIIEDQLAAAEKAYTFLKENTQKLFEHSITKMQGHLDSVNYAVTQNGSRGQKLELISNRLMDQQTNFETLKSENEDVDITEVAIQLSSAELTYNAALMATGKLLQNSLMNFI